jgi:hypothetical protein
MELPISKEIGREKLILDNQGWRSTMDVSPPIPVRIEWADSQGRVTASWLAAHFIFGFSSRSYYLRQNMTRS